MSLNASMPRMISHVAYYAQREALARSPDQFSHVEESRAVRIGTLRIRQPVKLSGECDAVIRIVGICNGAERATSGAIDRNPRP